MTSELENEPHTWPLAAELGRGVASPCSLAVDRNVDSAQAKSQIIRLRRATPTTTQAGGHPDVVTTVNSAAGSRSETVPCDCNDPTDLTLHSPTGVIGNPHVVSDLPG